MSARRERIFCASTQHPQRRIRGAYLWQVCVAANGPVTLRCPTEAGYRRISSLHLHRPVGNGLIKHKRGASGQFFLIAACIVHRDMRWDTCTPQATTCIYAGLLLLVDEMRPLRNWELAWHPIPSATRA
jgi:hypothetical protein